MFYINLVLILFPFTSFWRQLSNHIKHVTITEYTDGQELNTGLYKGEKNGG